MNSYHYIADYTDEKFPNAHDAWEWCQNLLETNTDIESVGVSVVVNDKESFIGRMVRNFMGSDLAIIPD